MSSLWDEDDDKKNDLILSALSMALRIMPEVRRPNSAVLDAMNVLRDLREMFVSRVKELEAERDDPALARLKTLVEDDPKLSKRMAHLRQRVKGFARELGLSEDEVEEVIYITIEDRMRAAGVDTEALHRAVKAALLRGDMKTANALLADAKAAVDKVETTVKPKGTK